MKELLGQLSSYNLFNYLLPGVLFAVIATRTTQLTLVIEDVVLGAFLYYFYGMVISRVGSVIIEPMLKTFKLVEFVSYEKYIAAYSLDSKIAKLRILMTIRMFARWLDLGRLWHLNTLSLLNLGRVIPVRPIGLVKYWWRALISLQAIGRILNRRRQPFSIISSKIRRWPT